MPGKITRLLACSEAQLAVYPERGMKMGPTFVHKNYIDDPTRCDAASGYCDPSSGSYNKPAAVMHWSREAAIERWTGWMAGSTDNGRDLPAGARQTKVYDRDTKVRQAAYGGLLAKYTSRFGDDGKGLAAADAGPMDEAYVGGAS